MDKVLLELVGIHACAVGASWRPGPPCRRGLDAGEELGPQQKWGAGWRANDRFRRQSQARWRAPHVRAPVVRQQMRAAPHQISVDIVEKPRSRVNGNSARLVTGPSPEL